MGCREKHGSPDELALLAVVDRKSRVCEAGRTSISDLDEDEATAVQHDEVDFTAPAAEVAGDGAQAAPKQISEYRIFGVFA